MVKWLLSSRISWRRAENIYIKTDGWTALAKESYQTIICHFVAEGKMVSAVLSALTRACWHANLTKKKQIGLRYLFLCTL